MCCAFFADVRNTVKSHQRRRSDVFWEKFQSERHAIFIFTRAVVRISSCCLSASTPRANSAAAAAPDRRSRGIHGRCSRERSCSLGYSRLRWPGLQQNLTFLTWRDVKSRTLRAFLFPLHWRKGGQRQTWIKGLADPMVPFQRERTIP